MRYCDDADCPNFEGGDCKLGYEPEFRVPKTIGDAVYPSGINGSRGWGYVMPKTCPVSRSYARDKEKGGSLGDIFKKLDKRQRARE